jgi:predicted 3-demethylubiquinone-9 3-methyltransferase (glyoxalase superfamily)
MRITDSNIRPFLMFEGTAEEAMNFYVSLFPCSKIQALDRYKAGGPGREGSIRQASFSIGSQDVLCTDIYVKHRFTFTPSFSFYVECQSEEELDRYYAALVDRGAMLMPPDNYGFSRKFAWVNDRFGVSWQLHLA